MLATRSATINIGNLSDSALGRIVKDIGMNRRTWIAAFGILFWVCQFVAEPALARDRRAARESFKRALSFHEGFLTVPRDQRPRAQYERAIFLYRRVIDHDPTYGACDDALFAVASLYDEMAGRFRLEGDRDKAIYYYRFVAREYPLTKHKGLALDRAEELDLQIEAERRAAERARATPKLPRETGDSGVTRSGKRATLNEIRYRSNEDYTRVVIQLDGEATFKKNVLSYPDRIYFDLENSQLASDIEKTYDVNGVSLRKVRVGENQPGMVRVVLDFEQIETHSVFALNDPFRIVIDIHGPRTSAAKTPGTGTVNTVEATISLDDQGTSRREVLTERASAPTPNLDGKLSLTRVLGLKVGKVAIDPGHGGRDTGTIGPGGTREKDLVLDISRRLRDLIGQRLGTPVVLTRDTDVFIPLEERTAIANTEGADLLISLHANASPNRKVSGIETFFLNFATGDEEREVASRENATAQRNIRELENLLRKIALGDYNEESRDLAHVIQDNLYGEMRKVRPRWRNRGVKQAPFIVLINSTMPSILTEIGFISNPSDEKYLAKDDARQAIAEALYRGVEQYFRALGSAPQLEKTNSGSGN